MLPGELRPSIFLSPHFDDVVLSCGGTVAKLVDAGLTPVVVTVFGGETLDEVLSDFARWKHERWQRETIDDVMHTRRAEEEAAAAIIGYRALTLGLPDAIYRGDRYGADDQLYAAPNSVEAGLVPLIADEVRSLPDFGPDTAVYVPLGAGSHVDHQIVHAVGQLLATQSVTVFAYEDTPYAIHTPASVAARLEVLGEHIGDPIVAPVGDAMETRIAAVASYETQVPVLFRFTDDWRRTLRSYAATVGGGGGGERFWPVLGF